MRKIEVRNVADGTESYKFIRSIVRSEGFEYCSRTVRIHIYGIGLYWSAAEPTGGEHAT